MDTKTLTKNNVQSGSFDATDKLLYLDDTAGIKGVSADNLLRLGAPNRWIDLSSMTVGAIKSRMQQLATGSNNSSLAFDVNIDWQLFYNNFTNENATIANSINSTLILLTSRLSGQYFTYMVVGSDPTLPIYLIYCNPDKTWYIRKI